MGRKYDALFLYWETSVRDINSYPIKILLWSIPVFEILLFDAYMECKDKAGKQICVHISCL